MDRKFDAMVTIAAQKDLRRLLFIRGSVVKSRELPRKTPAGYSSWKKTRAITTVSAVLQSTFL
jgi:hypothetical protein